MDYNTFEHNARQAAKASWLTVLLVCLVQVTLYTQTDVMLDPNILRLTLAAALAYTAFVPALRYFKVIFV